MKVLIVNTYDITGGAAVATFRLHQALLSAGVDSQMLVQSKISDDFTVLGPKSSLNKFFAQLRPTFDNFPISFYRKRSKTLFSPAWVPFSGIVTCINALKPDVVHLHWIGGGMMRIEDIAKIKAPIVWSLHDMWAFTGGCHYDEDCGGYKNQCGNCKVLASNKLNDISRKTFKRKIKEFSKIKNLTIVGLSKWLTHEAKESILFSNKLVINVPNPINTNVFAPFNQSLARDLLNLPKDKKLVLFGAVGATTDLRKGFKELAEALAILDFEDIEFVVFGSSQPKETQGFKFKVHYLGHLHDTISLRILYNAADVMVVPSLQENLSNVILESLACGTPVVAFNIGGNSDMIDHKKNGYLAQPFDSSDLAKGIEWVLYHSDTSELLSAARKKVHENFDSRVVVKKYIALYEKILKKDYI